MGGKWRTLLAVAISTFMLLLDVTVVNVALPEIQRDLDAGFTELQWVIDAYALTLAAALLIAGSLGDRLGRRFVFSVGLAVFSLASLACAFAWSPVALDVARGVQGLGGAAMLAMSLALIGATYTGADRRVALAVWGATAAGATAIGPMIGGALVEALGWQSIFLINLPIGAATVALVLRGVAESRDPSATGAPDFAGLVTMGGAMSMLVVALLRGNDEGWGSTPIVALFAGAAVLATAFAAIELRARQPLLDLRLLANRSTLGASLGVLALAMSVVAMLTFVVLYIQNVLGYGPFDTGLRLFPLTVASFFAAALTARLGERVPVAAMLATGLAIAGSGLLASRGVEAGSDWTILLWGGILIGLGFGAANPAVAAAAIGTVAEARGGMASGLNGTFRLLGVAIGVALWGSLHEHRVREHLGEQVAGVPEAGADLVASGRVEAFAAGASSGSRAPLEQAAEAAFVAGFDRILLAAAVVAFAGAALTALLVRAKDFVQEEEAEAQRESAAPAPAG
jgi:EmrB/QacA subfamily drug resistance transporter